MVSRQLLQSGNRQLLQTGDAQLFQGDPGVPPPTGPHASGETPTSGSAAGGESIVIAGTAFSGAVSVKFGGVEATSFTIDSDIQITAVAPPHSPGVVEIVVT